MFKNLKLLEDNSSERIQKNVLSKISQMANEI